LKFRKTLKSVYTKRESNPFVNMGTCIMVFLLCVMCAVDACYLAITNERLQPCQVSQWIAWNCTCCGLNALNLHLATRARGLCCPVDKSHDYGACKRYCNISESMIFEYGSCGFNCRQTLRPSPCLHTTRGSTRAVSFTPLPASSTHHTSSASSVAANATWTRHKHGLPEKTAADHCYIGSLKYIVDENFGRHRLQHLFSSFNRF